MKGVLCIPQSSGITGTSPSELFIVISKTLVAMGWFYLFTEKQSVYFTAPATCTWVSQKFCNILVMWGTIRQLWMILQPPPKKNESHWTVRCPPWWSAVNTLCSKEDRLEKQIGFLSVISNRMTQQVTIYTSLKKN